MAKGNFNNQTKRTRELKKKDKRAAKDEKRAQKKAEARAARAAAVGGVAPSLSKAPVVKPPAISNVSSPASAVLQWMNKAPSGRRPVR